MRQASTRFIRRTRRRGKGIRTAGPGRDLQDGVRYRVGAEPPRHTLAHGFRLTLSAGGNRIRTIGPAVQYRPLGRFASVSERLGWRLVTQQETSSRRSACTSTRIRISPIVFRLDARGRQVGSAKLARRSCCRRRTRKNRHRDDAAPLCRNAADKLGQGRFVSAHNRAVCMAPCRRKRMRIRCFHTEDSAVACSRCSCDRLGVAHSAL